MNQTLNNKTIDIKNLKAAKRYALALVESAHDNLDEILDDLSEINGIIFKNKDFKMFFTHPAISLKDKKDILNDALYGKINEKTLNFLKTLLDEGRLNIFETIYGVIKSEINAIKNKQCVEIISAVELDEDAKNKLKEKLNAKLKKDVILNYCKDEDILGGLVIKMEDKVIDLSLKTRFEVLRKSN